MGNNTWSACFILIILVFLPCLLRVVGISSSHKEAYIVAILLIIELAAARKRSLLGRRAGGVRFFVVWKEVTLLATV